MVNCSLHLRTETVANCVRLATVLKDKKKVGTVRHTTRVTSKGVVVSYPAKQISNYRFNTAAANSLAQIRIDDINKEYSSGKNGKSATLYRELDNATEILIRPTKKALEEVQYKSDKVANIEETIIQEEYEQERNMSTSIKDLKADAKREQRKK